MSYTVMSDEILKEFDSKIYYAATKNRNNRKRAEVNTVHKEFIKTPIFKDINKPRLQDRVDKLLKNGTLLSNPFRDKESLRINRDKTGFPHNLQLQQDPRHMDYLYQHKIKEYKFLCH